MAPIYQVFVADYDGELPVLLTTNEQQAREVAASLREVPHAVGGLSVFLFNQRKGSFRLTYVIRWEDGKPAAAACYCSECVARGVPPWEPVIL